ncbi:MAG: hypothetical protein ACYSVY_16940 [Planctomycetota bacterium]|jgi:uncharacterized paraquat-inducible protein A
MSPETRRDSAADDPHDDELFDEREGPQACDLNGDDRDEYDLIRCPGCGRDISELAERCPHCGDWVIRDTATGVTRKPLVIAIAILLLVLLLLWIL